MNTVQHKKSTVTRHEIRMHGPITARDIGDFVHQVNAIYEEVTGHPVRHDDAYYVTGDDEGLTATFETEEGSSDG